MVSEIIKNLGSIVQEKTGNDPAIPLTDRLKKIGKGALAIASGRAVPYAIGKAGEKILPQPTEEEVKIKEAEIQKKEILGQIELNTKMGWNSDTSGNVTTRIEGFNEEEALKKSLEGYKKPFNPAEKVSDAVGAGFDIVKDAVGKGLKKTGQFADKVINGDTVTWIRADEQVASPVQGQKLAETKAEVKPIKPEDFVWQEREFMPYIKDDTNPEGFTLLKDLDFKPQQKKNIKKITLRNKDGSVFTVIEDPKKLELANIIKSVSDAVEPKWTNYLLKLAQKEGIYDAKQRNYIFNETHPVKQADGTIKQIHYSSNNPADAEKHGGLWSTDRGVFQINDAAFPGVPTEMADDPVKATLWAIAAIEANKQGIWYADQATKDTTIEIDEEDITSQTPQ